MKERMVQVQVLFRCSLPRRVLVGLELETAMVPLDPHSPPRAELLLHPLPLSALQRQRPLLDAQPFVQTFHPELAPCP